MLCLRNARWTISSISDFVNNHICTRLGAWYMLYFLFQAGLIPIILLMTDPTSTDAPAWLQDVETTKKLLTHPSLSNNRLATRCLEVVNRLCSPTYTSSVSDGSTPIQPPMLMQFSDQLLNDPMFGSMFPDVDQELNLGGMDFSEWNRTWYPTY